MSKNLRKNFAPKNQSVMNLQIPPNRAKIAVKGKISTVSEFSDDLKSLGLTASDFAPIDWRKRIDLVHVKNQGDCGDCWAQSSASALSDRFMIQKNIKNLDINAVIVTQCAASSENQGCNGDNPYDAGEYFASTGGVNSSSLKTQCPSWASLCVGGKGCTNLPTCEQLTSECVQSGVTLYKTVPDSIKSTAVVGNSPLDVNEDATILNMKRHLMDGPYPVCFFVPNDFYGPSLGYNWESTNGVYINGMYNDDLDRIASANVKSSLGISDKSQWGDIIMEDGGPAGHAVELVGWGMENAGKGRENIPCWYIKNSWGPSWNESGYFRMAMNDFSTTNQRYNNLLGLDIPVSSVTQQSSGKVLQQENSLFGGGTVFDPDTSSGDPSGSVLSRNSSTTEKIVFWSIIGLLVVFSGIILYRVLKK